METFEEVVAGIVSDTLADLECSIREYCDYKTEEQIILEKVIAALQKRLTVCS
jgi:hypothetical protein